MLGTLLPPFSYLERPRTRIIPQTTNPFATVERMRAAVGSPPKSEFLLLPPRGPAQPGPAWFSPAQARFLRLICSVWIRSATARPRPRPGRAWQCSTLLGAVGRPRWVLVPPPLQLQFQTPTSVSALTALLTPAVPSMAAQVGVKPTLTHTRVHMDTHIHTDESTWAQPQHTKSQVKFPQHI